MDAPITCKLLSHSLACHPPSVSKKKKISQTGPNWADDKSAEFCQSCGFQFNVLIRRHHCRHCGLLFCRYCAQDRWPLPKYEYLHPVRVCRKCSRLCWKAEALVQAITNNDINSLAKYVQRKNDCNLHTGIYPPLIIAATQGFSEICRILITGGAKVNYSVPAPQKTTLVTCAYCMFTDAFVPSARNEYECQRCHEITHTIADTDAAAAFKGGAPSDHIGMTPLHAAVRHKGHVDVVRALVTNGANLNARTHNGNTALHLACANGYADCCKLLIRRDADINAICDFDGDMPLHRGAPPCSTLLHFLPPSPTFLPPSCHLPPPCYHLSATFPNLPSTFLPRCSTFLHLPATFFHLPDTFLTPSSTFPSRARGPL